MKKFNLVKLDQEVWWALSECYASYGFNSRQDLIDHLLSEWVKNNAPDELAKAVNKLRSVESTKAVVDMGPVKIPPLMVESKTKMYNKHFTRMKLYFKDGREEIVEAPSPLEGLIMVELEGGLTQKDFEARVERIEFLEKKDEEKH